MTIRMYARRKEIALSRVSVDVTHEKRHVEDCEDCEAKGARIDLFRRAIRLDGDLTDAQRRRLMEIADRCPVHRTLEGEIRIETVETEPDVAPRASTDAID
jgi:putative redox protein